MVSKGKVVSSRRIKVDRTNANNYRLISLVDTHNKRFTRIVYKLLKFTVSEEQMGFRKGRSCTDATVTLKQIVSKKEN